LSECCHSCISLYYKGKALPEVVPGGLWFDGDCRLEQCGGGLGVEFVICQRWVHFGGEAEEFLNGIILAALSMENEKADLAVAANGVIGDALTPETFKKPVTLVLKNAELLLLAEGADHVFIRVNTQPDASQHQG